MENINKKECDLSMIEVIYKSKLRNLLEKLIESDKSEYKVVDSGYMNEIKKEYIEIDNKKQILIIG